MVVNHAGYQLLGHAAAGDGWPSWLVFVGSAAPALFFFATGVGAGLSNGRPDSVAAVARKVLLLLVADMLMNWGNGTLFGLDFFGFAAVSTAVLFASRRTRRPGRAAAVLLVLVVTARFGLAVVMPDRHANGFAFAFITGIGLAPHISYPLCPWLAFPLLGFLVGRQWRDSGSPNESGLIGTGAVVCVLLSVALAAHGAPVFRWGSVSLAYFLCAIGIVGLAWLVAAQVARALPSMALAMSLRGPASLLIVPLHYGALGMLEYAAEPPWNLFAWGLATLLLIVAVLLFARYLVSGASRFPVPGLAAQVFLAVTACGCGLMAFTLAPPLGRLEACSAGDVIIALLLLWSSQTSISGSGAGAAPVIRA